MTDLFRDADPEPELDDARDGRGDPPQGRRSRRASSDRHKADKRRSQRRRTLVSFVVMVVALGLLAAGAWIFVRPIFTDRPDSTQELFDYPGPGSGSVEVVVANGDSGAAIGRTLVEADVVATVDAFVAAYSANADAPSIQPGTYTLPQQIPATQAVTALLDSANRTGGLTIPEGWRASQIFERVAEVLEISVEDVEAAAQEVELPDEADGEIEGWLFASTYSPSSDATPVEVLQEMVDRTVAVLERNDVPRERWHHVIIVASIVEREVSQPDDRPLAAQVIENRLDYCNNSGELEMDSTLSYELDKPANQITQTEWGTQTPYNTRTFAGLPPTAISSPSESAIDAAANPPAGDYCYFVTVDLDTGETKFTADYDEFLEFRSEYQDWVANQQESD